MRWSLPLSSLRGRLLAGFVLVILITLLSAGSAVLWLIQGYQRRLAVDRLGEVSVAASLLARQLEARDAKPEEIGVLLAHQLIPQGLSHVRVLVVDAQGRVVAEQAASSGPLELVFTGKQVEVPAGLERSRPEGGPSTFFRARTLVWTDAEGPGRQFIFVATPPSVGPVGPVGHVAPPGMGVEPRVEPRIEPRPERPERGEPRGDAMDRFLGRSGIYRIVLAVPEANLGAAWRELAPSLAYGAIVGIALAALVAYWLSRSITHPLRQITLAAQRIARGELKQSIPVRGRDEVAHLAIAFNSMSHEVEQSHRALRDFLANASHELRTPLTSIQGFSQALLDGALTGPDGALEAGQIIHEEANRMRGLVEDLLYLSRVESQDAPEVRIPIDVAALIRESSRRLQYVAEQRGLHMAITLPALPAVVGDPDELDRLFGNLLDNAGKYTPKGGQITVDGSHNGGQIEIAITNTGAVIAEDDLPHIFERFYRVDKSRARGVEGSGLGLAIAKEVTERHGGRIAAESTVSTGTSFTVILPAVSAVESVTATASLEVSPATA